MMYGNLGKNLSRFRSVLAAWLVTILLASSGASFEVSDPVSAVFESPNFKGKEPIQKLQQAAELIREKKLKQSEMDFALLDWGDQYLREPSDPLDRLKRWAQLNSDEKLSHSRIPREFLNRMLLAEYLVEKTPYLTYTPQKKLEILHKLAQQKLVHWSVLLEYARLYAGAVVTGAKGYSKTSPVEALGNLKNLKDQGLVGLHYRTPTEAILAAEALAMDSEYTKALPYERLVKLRELERKGLVSNLSKRELERLPAWRLLVADPAFMKSDAAAKEERLSKLKDQGLISSWSYKDLAAIFRPAAIASPAQTRPTPVPQKAPPPAQYEEDAGVAPKVE
ncbi:MAG TPA: hypothetical protein VMC85_03140 [Desulfomonilaceae bacterium]|nr:hypothetical protein [Desulfomonilaceae bacterium]